MIAAEFFLPYILPTRITEFYIFPTIAVRIYNPAARPGFKYRITTITGFGIHSVYKAPNS